jgi:hypothetical protein
MRRVPKEKISLMDIVSLANKTSQTSEKAGKAMDLLYMSAFFPHIKIEITEPSVCDEPCGKHLKIYSDPADLAALMPVYVPVPVTATAPVPTEEEDLYA